MAVKLTGLLQLLEWAAYDQFSLLRPTESVDERLLLVTVDEADINQLGQWPLADETLAELINILNQYQPVAIGLDFYRDLPVEPGHQAWVRVMLSTPHLIGVEKAIGRTVAPPSTLSELGQVGLTDLLVDADGKVRRALLSHSISAGSLRFGLGVELALAYLEDRGITLETLDQTKKHYRLGQGLFFPFKGDDGGYVRTNAGGYQILLNYRGQQEKFRTLSLRAVLAGEFEPEVIRDRLVLIGSTAPSLNDLFYTPYSNRLTNTPQPTAGVVIHANLTSQLLSAALDGRPLIRVWPEPFEWLWTLVWSSVGAAGLGWLLESNQQQQRISTRLSTLGIYIFLAGGMLIAGGYFVFLRGWWIPVIPPLIALIGSASLVTTIQILKLQQQRLELSHQKLKAEAASQAKSQFLAQVSHELRTPLGVILGFADMMHSDSSLNAGQKEKLGIISRSSEHLLSLINDVLAMSKIEAGRITLNETSFDLHRLLGSLQEMLQFQAESKDLKFAFDKAANVPQFVITDEGKLRQVLINLLGNALKFTEKGGVTLRVMTSNQQSATNQQSTDSLFPPPSHTPHPTPHTLHFEVEDTGPGIAPDEMASLFDAFAQGKMGRRSKGGTGLGLSISRQFINLMGGDISVSSTLGQGARFQFNIQVGLAQPTELESPQPPRKVIGLAPDQPVYRILIVEDHKVNRLLMVKMLTSLGFQVNEAANGQEAVDLWREWRPDLIWMDIQMPIMDGYEATRRIKGNRQAPIIIALTASAFEEDRAMILSIGCDDFVSKPFRQNVIVDKLAQHLGVRYVYAEAHDVAERQRQPTLSQSDSISATANPNSQS